MVHQYKNNGYNIVLDVNSGAIHVVDDVTYDVIELFEDNSAKEIIEKLVDRYPQTEIEEAIQEVNELKDNEELFTEDTYKERIIDFKKRQTVVKALCLHIAHDCNLACRYCFAEEGEYHGRRALMSYETGNRHLIFDCQFRQQEKLRGRLLWRRASYELGCGEAACGIWKRAGEAS